MAARNIGEDISAKSTQNIIAKMHILSDTNNQHQRKKKGRKNGKSAQSRYYLIFYAALKSPTLLVISTLKNSVKKWFERLKPNF